MKEYIVQAIAQETIDTFDAHNAPELIRCKDCKNWVGNGVDISELPYWLPCKGEVRRPDYFCADGERR